jgi:hypothetical protein
MPGGNFRHVKTCRALEVAISVLKSLVAQFLVSTIPQHTLSSPPVAEGRFNLIRFDDIISALICFKMEGP